MKIKNWMILPILIASISVFHFAENEAKRVVLKGNSAYPALTESGDFVFIFNSQNEGLSTVLQHADSSAPRIRSLMPQSNISTPVIKKDRLGRLRAVWEEEYASDSIIALALLDEDRVVETRPVCLIKGYHFSPDLTFDQNNNLWIAWILYSQEKHHVLVKDMTSKRLWKINTPFLDGAFSPQIIADPNNGIWVFWTGNREGRDEILYSHFNGLEWTAPSGLGIDSHSPRILPAVSLDKAGHPWVTWCAHDGSDYEIYFSCWEGHSWSREEQLTANRASDVQPCLSFVSGDIPVFVWTQTTGHYSRVCLRYIHEGQWSPVHELDRSSKASTSFPRIITLGDRMGITWQSKGDIRSIFLSFHQLQNQVSTSAESAESVIPLGEWPDENKYIGFGDSITFGMIDYKETPQLGYIPRLASLLYKTYGLTQVINEGWPGEVTEQGLARISNVLDLHNALFFLLMEGTNDVVFKRISMDTTVFNLEQMIQICRNKSVFPILTTIIPRNDKRWQNEFFRNRIFDLNDKIRELAAKVNVSFIDMFEIFYTWPESDGGWTSLLSNDYVHPSIKGYEIMTESWFEEIKKLPFPPGNVNVARLVEHMVNSLQEANRITWNHSQKLFDIADFKAYKVYRSKADAEPTAFTLIKTVSLLHRDAFIAGSIVYPSFSNFGHSYLDLDIDSSSMYNYILALVRKDGIAGPLSQIAKDKTKGGTGH